MAEAGEPDINDILIHHLQAKNEIIAASKVFALQQTNKKRVQLAFELLQENRLLPVRSIDGKSDARSIQFRQQGNEKFRLKQSRQAVELYTKSIAHAATPEVQSLAYANRSAVLFEHCLYHDCICDIQRALDNNYPGKLKDKLQIRLDKAKERMGSGVKIKYATPIPMLTPPGNPLIQSACSNVELRTTTTMGRHVVATCDIQPGDVIAIEQPYAHVLWEQPYIHCHHCVMLCYNLIPCPGCTQALFCSDDCLRMSMKYHQYECPIILSIQKMDLTCRWLHLRVAILGCQDQSEDDVVFRSDRYKEMHSLVSNTEKRSVADLFSRAVHSASFYHLLKISTKFFDTYSEERFMELVLLHMQTGPCNFHQIAEVKSSSKSLDSEEVGSGAYAFMSMFNHSCIPNCTRYSYGTTVVAVAIEKIKKGEQCFDNYGYHHALMSKTDRQMKLKKQYFFDCTCIACINDYPQYDHLRRVDDKRYIISLKDMEFLEKRNQKETKRIYKDLCRKIEELQKRKPCKNLSEMQEALKQCYFNFETVMTPI